MALITCPECGGQVSDKAETCPHCGYPIAKDIHGTQSNAGSVFHEEQKYYSFMLLKHHVLGGSLWSVILNMIQCYFPDKCKPYGPGYPLNHTPCTLGTGLTKENAEWLKDEFQRHRMDVAIPQDSSAKYNQTLNETINKTRADKDIVKCPRCGSTQITTGQRGYGLITGPFGSGKTVNRCSKCGLQWRPMDYGVEM